MAIVLEAKSKVDEVRSNRLMGVTHKWELELNEKGRKWK